METKRAPGRPKQHGSRAFRDLLLRSGTASLGIESDLGKLALAYKKAWRAELDYDGWGLTQDSDLEDACVGYLRHTRALRYELERPMDKPPNLATNEVDTGSVQERAALDRIRAAKEAWHPQVKQILETIAETREPNAR
jgi:hypothetical protein